MQVDFYLCFLVVSLGWGLLRVRTWPCTRVSPGPGKGLLHEPARGRMRQARLCSVMLSFSVSDDNDHSSQCLTARDQTPSPGLHPSPCHSLACEHRALAHPPPGPGSQGASLRAPKEAARLPSSGEGDKRVERIKVTLSTHTPGPKFSETF